LTTVHRSALRGGSHRVLHAALLRARLRTPPSLAKQQEKLRCAWCSCRRTTIRRSQRTQWRRRDHGTAEGRR
jgi:hypothetical protein